MNETLFQINEEYCIVSKDDNSIRVCTKNNNNHTFKEILAKENTLDELYIKKHTDIDNLVRSYKVDHQVISAIATLIGVDIFITNFNTLGEYFASIVIASELGVLLANMKMNKDSKKSDFASTTLKAKSDLKKTNKNIKELEEELKTIKKDTGFTQDYNLLSYWYENEVYANIADEKEKLLAMRKFLHDLANANNEEIRKEESVILKRTMN